MGGVGDCDGAHASLGAETLARRPETLAAALDDIGGSDDAVVALAARCVAELVGGGCDVGWDWAGIPPATAVDVLEAAARKSPNETTHLAVAAAMGATLASASTARGATESNDDAYDGTNRASAFLCRVAPNSPHLFSDVVAWEARRAAVDAAFARGTRRAAVDQGPHAPRDDSCDGSIGEG